MERLIRRDDVIKQAVLLISIPALLYTIMYVLLTIAGGAPSSFEPWLNIPKNEYYSVNRFLLAPSLIVSWFTVTSFIQVSARLDGSTGTFEQTLAATALSISLAMWGGLIHDLPVSFLSAAGILDAGKHEIAMNSPTLARTILWICYSIYFLAFILLFPLAVRTVHRMSIARSIIIGIMAFFIFQLLFLVFNR